MLKSLRAATKGRKA